MYHFFCYERMFIIFMPDLNLNECLRFRISLLTAELACKFEFLELENIGISLLSIL